jgi:transcriptional regulator with XRE-family HTH domain
MKAERRARTEVTRARARTPRETPAAHDAEARTQDASQHWLQAFGRHLRDVREVLGLSQQQVSARAGVSQAALARLEAGHGPTTPVVSVLKIDHVLTDELAKVDPAWLAQELPRHVRIVELLALLTQDGPVAADGAVDELVELHHRTPARLRTRLLAIVRTAADGLRTSAG